MIKFFRFPFAASGDKSAVPDTSQPTGVVSYEQGWGPDYQLNPKADPNAKPVDRQAMNQILADVTAAIREQQTTAIPDWIAPIQNGGLPFAYAVNALVRYDDGGGVKIYVNTIDGNTNDPTGAGWSVAPLSGAAPLDSPAFTGTPTAPTAAPGTSTTQLATTAFVAAAVAGGGGGSTTATVTLADNVTVGDFVAAINSGNIERVKSSLAPIPSPGTPVTFEAAATNFIAAAYDTVQNAVVIAYQDGGNSNYGTAIVGTVSGTTITFGTAVVFRSIYSDYISAAYDASSGKIVIAYRIDGSTGTGAGGAIVGTVSGTTITFGSTVVFNSSASSQISASYSPASSNVVISYRNGGNSNYGTSIVGTVSGTTISFGSSSVFRSSACLYISNTYDAASANTVISFRDDGDFGAGKSIVGTVSGTSITFGSVAMWQATSTAFVTSSYGGLPGKIVVAYQDGTTSNYGTAIVGTVSGTTISFGAKTVFKNAQTSHIAAAADPSAGVMTLTYADGGNGEYATASTGTVSGTAITFGASFAINAVASRPGASVYANASGKIVSAYFDNAAPNYGKAAVMSSQTTITNAPDVCGVATETKLAGQTCKITPLGGIDTTTSGLSTGQDYYITDAGVRVTTAGTNTYVGRALSPTALLLRGITKRT